MKLQRQPHTLRFGMASAIQNLRNAILDPNQSLTQLLRQAKVIAAELGLEDVEKWVDCELKGYPDDAEKPNYREVAIYGIEAFNPARGWEFVGNMPINLPLPPYCQPIDNIENLSKAEQVHVPLPPGPNPFGLLRSTHGSQISLRFVTSGEQFKRILEAVRNQLLEWTIGLKKRGIVGEDMNFNENEKRSANSYNFNNCNVGMAGEIRDSQASVNGDYRSILLHSNLPKADRRELEDILDDLETAPADKKPSLVECAKKLINKHKDILGTGAEMLGKILGGYMSHHEPNSK